MATTNGSSINTQTLRNIIVGVTTTVLASTIVYFLGFHKSGRSSADSMLFTKEATIGAWATYVSTENMFTKNWKTLGANYSASRFKNYKDASLEELDKFYRDIKALTETQDIDPSFLSLLKRRLAAKQQWESKYRIHLDNFEAILNNTAQQEQNQKQNDELNRFRIEVKDVDERFVNEIEDIVKALSEKYHHNFSSSDLIAFKKTDTDTLNNRGRTVANGGNIDRLSLVGTWLIDQNWFIYHYDDGRLYMYFTRTDGARDSTYGTWQISNNQLHHHSTYYFSAGTIWAYDVSNITSNSFSMRLAVSPYTEYIARRYNW